MEGRPDPPAQFRAVAVTRDTVTLEWRLDFTGGFKPEDISYRIRLKKEGAEQAAYRDVPKAAKRFTVDDLQVRPNTCKKIKSIFIVCEKFF